MNERLVADTYFTVVQQVLRLYSRTAVLRLPVSVLVDLPVASYQVLVVIILAVSSLLQAAAWRMDPTAAGLANCHCPTAALTGRKVHAFTHA